MVFVGEPKPVGTRCSTAPLRSSISNFSINYSRQFSAGYTDKFDPTFLGCLPANLDVDVVSSLGHGCCIILRRSYCGGTEQAH